MDTFTKRDLERLLEEPKGPFVSLYLRTHRAGEAGQEGPIRLKNLARSAEDQLVSVGGRAPDVHRFLEPVWKLLNDELFWKNQSEGLAIFRAADLFATYRLNLPFADVALAGERFHIRPLLPLLGGDKQFWILAVSQKSARLLEATHDQVMQRTVEGLPASLDEALGYDEQEQRFPSGFRQAHGGPQPHVYHGKGSMVDIHQADTWKYFEAIDRALHATLKDSRAPLVAAMLERHFPVFKEACSYPQLVPQPLAGSPEMLSAEELRTRAWPLVEPIFEKECDAWIERYWQWAHDGKATNYLQEIVPAARQGQIAALFVQSDATLRGDIDSETGQVVVHADLTQGSEDLIDLVTAETLRNRGLVYPLPAEKVPTGHVMAAVLRYPITATAASL